MNNNSYEEIIYCDSLEEARKYLDNLMTNSGRFMTGSRPFYCLLPSSDAYGKIIGRISFDNQVRIRIDYDHEKGVHFNFEDFIGINYGLVTRPIKRCIIIRGMTKEQYLREIERMNYGQPKLSIEDIKLLYSKLDINPEIDDREVSVYDYKAGHRGVQDVFRKRTASYPNHEDSSLNEYIASTPTYLSNTSRKR